MVVFFYILEPSPTILLRFWKSWGFCYSVLFYSVFYGFYKKLLSWHLVRREGNKQDYPQHLCHSVRFFTGSCGLIKNSLSGRGKSSLFMRQMCSTKYFQWTINWFIALGGNTNWSLGGKTAWSLGGKTTWSLDGRTTRSLDGKTIRSLDGKTTWSLGGMTTWSLDGKPTWSLGGMNTWSLSGKTT